MGHQIFHARVHAELLSDLVADDVDEGESVAYAVEHGGRVDGPSKFASGHHAGWYCASRAKPLSAEAPTGRLSFKDDLWVFRLSFAVARKGTVSMPGDEDNPRMRSAWRTWLSALAVDAEAALAAALAYESLAPEGRDAWLVALAEDMSELARAGVPPIALYSPLLWVELDPERRARIEAELASKDSGPSPNAHKVVRALCGRSKAGEHVALILSPLYLDFVAVLACRYHPEHGFRSARHDPVRHVTDVVGEGSTLDGVPVAEAPLRDVIEDLAHAIVSDRREGRAAPPSLRAFAHLFVPDIGPNGALFPESPGDIGDVSPAGPGLA
jgi:hypothetical protein